MENKTGCSNNDVRQVIMSGLVIMTLNGCLYLWGNISPYVLAYFYHYGIGESDNLITLQDTVSVLPLMATMMMVFQPISASIIKWGISPKIVILAGSLISASACFWASTC